ncbi:MAG: GNAT family N-acetyltransferase [Armatimonadota bacterium]|nr:MAG: GNAT family N-acetyltransferase [Armatimonadota bacterium]
MPKLSYRPYQPEDAERLCHLQAAVFGVPRVPEYWHWKYRANPAGNDMTWVAEDTETHKIVGMNGLVPIRVGVHGEQVIACQSLDIAVLEEYRRYLVHLEMAIRQKSGDWAFTFAFGEADTVKVSTALMGFVVVGATPRVVNPLSLQPGVPPRWRGLARAADPIFRLVRPLRYVPPPRGAVIEPVLRFDERYDRFWSAQAKNYPLAVWRDSAYLNWRYLDVPEEGYEAYGMERQGEVLGFSVLRRVPMGRGARGRILELIAAENDRAITQALLSHALHRFREQSVELAAAWIFDSDPRWSAMKDMGFVSRPRPGRQIVVSTVSGEVPAEMTAESDNWRISWGDSVEG